MLAFSAMFALLITFAIQRVPHEERIVVERPKIETRADDMVVLAKADRQPIRVVEIAAVSKPVVVERITPAPDAPASAPPVILVDDPDKPVTSRRHGRRLHMDVCTRHHMRRVETHGGRSWRCRR